GGAGHRARHAVIDARALAADAAALVQIPSVTGHERGALERLAALAEALGLRGDLREHDLQALRAHPDHPGEEARREELWGLTLEGVVPGVAAHAAHRLQGVSAIDRYLPVHQALAAHERALNADVEHPLMRALELPYPLLVGRVEAGEWSSSVPDRLRFEGRA